MIVVAEPRHERVIYRDHERPLSGGVKPPALSLA
jgi:hypothetical protein